MKKLDEVKAILAKHDLEVKLPECCKTNLYDCECEGSKSERGYPDDFNPEKNDGDLYQKYKEFIPAGWYGFALGKPTPNAWVEALEEVLDLLVKTDPNFQIHQIKTKFGGIRFYVHSDVIEDIWDIETTVDGAMFSNLLIY